MRRIDVAMGDDLERGQEFLAEIVLSAADTGKRRGRAHDRALADLGAIIRLHPPDGGDDVPIDPIGFLDRIENRPMARQDGAAILDAIIAHQKIQIVPDCLGEFRLRIKQVHDPQVGRQGGGLLIEHGPRHPAARRLRP